MVFANADIREELPKEEAYGLIRYHDEEIWECLPKHAGRVAELGEKSVTDAGIFYSLNVKLTAEAKVGDNWANVH
jgi:DNA polymerase I-like protein with 3'-5' exonuclease and polymerase domains